ncbi:MULTISPECIES: hypothetical protein [Desulfosediminicola]|uniref:hypothetical protein n=1 Tax=Desulfosediminicola TaxID=2886823 RepID=UPI0010ACA3CA|nr:hypothetical protein [Desulfosediminicola ganghwensis]
MEIQDYCKNVDTELSQWQEKLSHIVSQLDNRPTSSKQGVYEEVNGLHMIITEMSDRIDQLRNECSISWEPQKEDEKTPNIAGSSKRFNQNEELRFDYDFGG